MCMGRGLCCGVLVYNVIAILSMAGMVCLACMQKLHVESMSSAVSVRYVWYTDCTVCWSLSCEILLPLNMVGMDRWKTVERAMPSTLFI